jgi:plasmid maintenance system antidote protein VapI
MERKPFSDELRDAVRRSGRTIYDIAKAVGTPPSTIHRFVHGQAGLSLAMIDRLAEVLDLHVSVGKGG